MYHRKRKRSGAQYEFNGTPEDGAIILSGDAAQRDYEDTTPIWKQEVTDDRGRKRLHGAFTGGYTAGYFNTVGSKEGWTPSTFVSSRTAPHKAPELRAIDFMDEEDLEGIEQDRQLRIDAELKAKEEAGTGATLEGLTRRESPNRALPGTEPSSEALTIPAVARLPAPRGGAKSLALMDDDDEEDIFDVGAKIKYDRTLVKKKKKASGSTAQHTFSARKVLKIPAPEPEIYRRNIPSPKPTIDLQELLPSISDQTRTSPNAEIINPDRLAQMTADVQKPVPPWLRPETRMKEAKIPPWRQQEEIRVPAPIDSRIAQLALQSTFSPYPNDASKHARYRAYLEHEAGRSSSFGQGDFEQDTYFAECEEFRKCAMMYKPMTGIMLNKFTASTNNEQEQPPQENNSNCTVSLSAQLQAARHGKYGHLTRTVETWTAARLLSKRFDVHWIDSASKSENDEHTMSGTQVNKTMLDKLMSGKS